MQNLQSQSNILSEKKVRLATLQERLEEQPAKIDETKMTMQELKKEITLLEKRAKDLEVLLEKYEAEIVSLREKIARTESAEQYSGLERTEIITNLKKSLKGEYISEFTLSSIETMLTDQRNSQLRKKLYDGVSQVWSEFKGEPGWTVTLDQSALPSPQQEFRPYPFRLLSAGEKTALLVVTRTMLSALFAKSVGFLLLDEPLEHLDQRNRHSLLQFLADTCKTKIVTQLIVTTTESSLLRKFVDYEDIRIIPLD
jgi:DNA repair exonuclease SbcCD ATPase subunit